ncbi:unnamed protein product [Ectocarpus sp. 13 AM-2016]
MAERLRKEIAVRVGEMAPGAIDFFNHFLVFRRTPGAISPNGAIAPTPAHLSDPGAEVRINNLFQVGFEGVPVRSLRPVQCPMQYTQRPARYYCLHADRCCLFASEDWYECRHPKKVDLCGVPYVLQSVGWYACSSFPCSER